MMYIVRVEYVPKGIPRDDENPHRAIIRIDNWNLIRRCEIMLEHLSEEISSITIEGQSDGPNNCYLLSAGPIPTQPQGSIF
jgi:hypothetical protein